MISYSFLSADQKTNIQVYKFVAEKEKAILQIAHGMQEYSGRYFSFAQFLASNGYTVVINDHLGHGKSVIDNKYGYFGKDGKEFLINDMRSLYLKEKNDKPYFLLGHSMGSFLARAYCERVNDLSGAIFMGSGWVNKPLLKASLTMCKLLAKKDGEDKISPLLSSLSLGAYNKKFAPNRSEADWISSVEEEVDEYLNDEMCQIRFTINGYQQLFSLIKYQQDHTKDMANIPLLWLSGKDDPVGEMGKGITKAYNETAKYNKQMQMHLYDKCRHELLHEYNKEEVYQDILEWLNEKSDLF